MHDLLDLWILETCEICVKRLWNDEELMDHIRFCNDVMKIPPIKVFLLAKH